MTTPSYEEFADAQARLDEGEGRPGDEELTEEYDREVLQPAADARRLVTLTRRMAEVLRIEASNYGVSERDSVESWTARYGAEVVAELAAVGLICRDGHWTGCLVRTDLGERVANLLQREAGHSYRYATRDTWSDLRMSDDRWHQVRTSAEVMMAGVAV